MRKFIYAACFLFFISNTRAQNIETTLARYAKDYGEERMYLHYDKSAYAQGETIWFKAYLMKAIYPADEVKTLYIDWIDENGKLLLHNIYPVENAVTFGQFEIPEDYSGNLIHVKAYTKWMLNFDSSFLYNKDLEILSVKYDSATSHQHIIPKLNFFPEGGDAVVGVANKIAFKATDQYGRPIYLTGVVKNNDGAIVDGLNIIHDGMGFCAIRPGEGETFSAGWVDETGTTHETPLPTIRDSGICMQIFISQAKRTFSIGVSPASLAIIKKVHILGTMYHQLVFNLEEEIDGGMVQGAIPTGSLPSGILCITIFDDEWRPIAERITYINNEEYLFHPEITVQNQGLERRAKNEIQISVPGDISSDLSVSITDSKIEHDNSDNIISHLLLTGELKGNVTNPSYYFSNTSDSIARQLDLVMLTNGWRRLNWQTLMRGQFPVNKYSKDTSYLSLSGKIIGATYAQLKSAGNIILMVNQNNSGTQIFTVPIESNGSFNDTSLILFDTARVFYNFSNPKELKKVSVEFLPGILSRFSNYFETSHFYENNSIDTSGSRYQLGLTDEALKDVEYLKGKVLATVKIKSRIKSQKEILNDKYTSGLFKNNNATELDLVDDQFAKTYLDLITYIEEKVPGLTYDHVAGKFLWMRNRSGENSPAIFLNEMIASSATLSTLPVGDVAYIKVFRPGWIGGGGTGSGGAIAIYTRLGGEGDTTSVKGLDNSLINGYTVSREFYSPDYGTIRGENGKKDFRTTLYWNPSIITTLGQNKVNFMFFNNDVTKSFKVTIEGMTTDGQLTHIEKTIQ